MEEETHQQILFEVITFLKDTSKTEDNTTKWLSVLDIKTQKKGYNLSLSHGISSIVGFLTKLNRHNEFKESVGPLLNRAINFILNQNTFSKYKKYKYITSFVDILKMKISTIMQFFI